MQYILIEFTKGIECRAYQVISNGILIGYVDENGQELIPPEIVEGGVLDANPPRLDWMQ